MRAQGLRVPEDVAVVGYDDMPVATYSDPPLTTIHQPKLRMGQLKTASALLVNERAVGTDQNKKYVMVVGKDNTAAYREVTLGAHVNGLRIVTTGLKPDERVVVNGLQRIRPGALVAPQAVGMELKAEAKSVGNKS